MNLHLQADDADLELAQTPGDVTREAMRLYRTGCSGPAAFDHAADAYLSWLAREDRPAADCERERARISAFGAFATRPRFTER